MCFCLSVTFCWLSLCRGKCWFPDWIWPWINLPILFWKRTWTSYSVFVQLIISVCLHVFVISVYMYLLFLFEYVLWEEHLDSESLVLKFCHCFQRTIWLLSNRGRTQLERIDWSAWPDFYLVLSCFARASKHHVLEASTGKGVGGNEKRKNVLVAMLLANSLLLWWAYLVPDLPRL